MQVIILAAGRGTRLGALTENIPKPMIALDGKPILAHIIERLPRVIDEVVVAIGYHGEVIREYFQDCFEGRKISYVDASDLTGTAGALWKARGILEGNFLVMNGDDIFETEDLERLLRQPLAMGVFEGAVGFPGYWHIEADNEGMLQGMRPPTDEEAAGGFRIGAGAFVLDDQIFDHEPVRMRNGEYGLPQTVLQMTQNRSVVVVNMPSWRTVTHPEDVASIERYLASGPQRG